MVQLRLGKGFNEIFEMKKVFSFNLDKLVFAVKKSHQDLITNVSLEPNGLCTAEQIGLRFVKLAVTCSFILIWYGLLADLNLR